MNIFKLYFTHKDFLPSPENLPGTLFTPLHIIVSLITLSLIIALAVKLKNNKETLKKIYIVLWILLVVLEITKITWETLSGKEIRFEWGGILPLYPCSIFLYAFPFAIWGKPLAKKAACGYICSLGILGGAINFVYPANVLSNYSCFSFAGFHTLFYHGAIVFTALTMLLSSYHSYRGITKFKELLIPSIPFLIVSVLANIVNFSPIGSDYMFFRLNSFIFAPIGKATDDWLSIIIVYIAYLIIHALPYIPSYIKSKRKSAD